MNEADLLNEFKGNFAELLKLIKSWNLIKSTSRTEFEKLTEKILNELYTRPSGIRIKQIIESELCLTYGLYKTEFTSNQLTKEIMTWWNN